MAQPKTLFDKIWESHLIAEEDDGTCLIYIDRHLIHEITSAQAFGGLEESGRKVRRPDLTLAVPDHNVPTDPGRGMKVDDEEAQIQIDLLRKYATDAGIQFFDIDDIRQGIVHIIGPEQGFTLAGHHGGLRRQPHRDPWRLRRARVRHRHVRGGACAGHPDADPEAA